MVQRHLGLILELFFRKLDEGILQEHLAQLFISGKKMTKEGCFPTWKQIRESQTPQEDEQQTNQYKSVSSTGPAWTLPVQAASGNCAP